MEINSEMKIKEVISLNPKTADLMREMGMHCLGCPSASDESVAGAAKMHGIELEKLLIALNGVEQGEMSLETIAASQPEGAILQRDKQTYAIVPHIPAGICTPDTLRKIADIAEKYQAAALKLTTAQRIAIVGLKKEDVAQAWQDLGMDPGHAAGLCVRSVKTCPGTTFCKRGVQDSVTLGLELDKRYHGYALPMKFKIAVAGCPNKCTDAASVDLGFMGTAKGFNVFVGGKGGVVPRLVDLLVENVSYDQALEITEKILNHLKVLGRANERLGKLIDRVGMEGFRKAILA